MHWQTEDRHLQVTDWVGKKSRQTFDCETIHSFNFTI